MRRMCEESKDMGLQCMGMLDNQGEQIEKWEEVADGINEDMKLAEKALRDMDRACFGMIPKFWKIGGGFKEDDAVWKEPEQPKNNCLPAATEMNKDHKFVATSELSGEMNEKEEEMEENMNEVGDIALEICINFYCQAPSPKSQQSPQSNQKQKTGEGFRAYSIITIKRPIFQ